MNKTQPIRVMTVDDHELLRKGIRFSLLAVDDIELVAEARSGQEALSLCEQTQPDVVLMDMLLGGGMDGVTAISQIRKCYPKVQVLALSSFHERDLVNGAMQAGAIGYLVKGGSGDQLTNAIRAAHSGQTTLASEAAKALFETPTQASTTQRDELTERESQVLVFLVEGLSNPQIAERMHLSVAAIKYHVSNIISKLGATNRTEASILAIQQNLVTKTDDSDHN